MQFADVQIQGVPLQVPSADIDCAPAMHEFVVWHHPHPGMVVHVPHAT
jgi:hypothetical protein